MVAGVGGVALQGQELRAGCYLLHLSEWLFRSQGEEPDFSEHARLLTTPPNQEPGCRPLIPPGPPGAETPLASSERWGSDTGKVFG